MGLNGTIRKNLRDHRNQRVFMDWVGLNATCEESFVLEVRVYIKISLLKFQELRLIPEISLRWLNNLFEPGLENFLRPYRSCILIPKTQVLILPARFIFRANTTCSSYSRWDGPLWHRPTRKTISTGRGVTLDSSILGDVNLRG